MINDSEITNNDQSIAPILQMLITKIAVISALTKVTQNIHKDLKKLSYFIHRRQKVLKRTIKFNR